MENGKYRTAVRQLYDFIQSKDVDLGWSGLLYFPEID